MKKKHSSEFKRLVLNAVKQIPVGKTLFYEDVARIAGNKKASRAVGNILSSNYDPIIPCHRVVSKKDNCGFYNRGRNIKLILLRIERGVANLTNSL
jgi:methylated-DNA-[protein]-cysteine S-methyltransferase